MPLNERHHHSTSVISSPRHPSSINNQVSGNMHRQTSHSHSVSHTFRLHSDSTRQISLNERYHRSKSAMRHHAQSSPRHESHRPRQRASPWGHGDSHALRLRTCTDFDKWMGWLRHRQVALEHSSRAETVAGGSRGSGLIRYCRPAQR